MNFINDPNINIKLKLFGLIILVCGITFGFGVSVGSKLYPNKNKNQSNYTTNKESSQKTENKKPVNNITGAGDTNCLIKGNISGQKKTYHVVGGAFYDRTTAELCFDSEQEAIDAGFNKSSR